MDRPCSVVLFFLRLHQRDFPFMSSTARCASETKLAVIIALGRRVRKDIKPNVNCNCSMLACIKSAQEWHALPLCKLRAVRMPST